MILVDFHAIVIANIMQTLIMNENLELKEDLVRYMTINTLRLIKLRFGNLYGKIVISCDNKNYWRKDIFPFYKAKRIKDKQESSINWSEIHSYLEKIKKEIDDNFPCFEVLEINKAESDDIIAVLTSLYSNNGENCLIISRDKDFFQLHSPTVKQFDWIGDKFITIEDPLKTLFEHICKGDSADGIPNVMSPEDSFITGKRQKPMMQKKMDLWYTEKNIPDEIKPRFEKNHSLINFRSIPTDIREEIANTFIQKSINKKKNNIIKYFQEFHLKEMYENYQDFVL